MNLFYFNYSHELALANDRQNYFPPAHVRVMERDLMPLAAWVAGKEDAVAVESGRVGLCRDFFRRIGLDVCRFVPADALPSGCLPRPWGLDRHVVWQMRKGGADGLPGEEEIEDVRALSSRRLAVDLLAEVRCHLSDAPLCGESVYCQSEGEASRAVARYGRSVLKAPLSGSCCPCFPGTGSPGRTSRRSFPLYKAGLPMESGFFTGAAFLPRSGGAGSPSRRG